MAAQGRNIMGAMKPMVGTLPANTGLKPVAPMATTLGAQMRPMAQGMTPNVNATPMQRQPVVQAGGGTRNSNYQARTPVAPGGNGGGGPGQNRQNGGVPAAGGNNGNGVPQPQTAPAPSAAPAANQFQQVLQSQFGSGNPFGMQSWYGGNPLETAKGVADRAVQEQLAQLRARYGAQGLGASSRLGLAEGQAIADYGTGLGDALAQRGQAAYAQDASRGLEALMGAGQQDLMAKQLGLTANQQLMNAGSALTGIGQGEQSIPNLDSLLSYITNMGNTNTFGQVAMAGHGK